MEYVAVGMPKLGQYTPILDSVFFLYESRADAEVGKNSGGTGFLIAVLSERWGSQAHFVYGVTNWHVAVGQAPSASVIRLNTKSGKPAIIDLGPDQWDFIPGGPDLAISPPLVWSDDFSNSKLEFRSWALTESEESAFEINAADDVFMVGRFVDYDGEEANRPAVRFGHISIMDARIVQDTGYSGRSIVVDMHSRSGFSGSPVFVFRTLGSHFMPDAQPGQFLTGGGHTMKLLGVHWGQFPENWELTDKKKARPHKHASLITTGAYVEGLSGMTCVIPTSELIKLIDSPAVKAKRDAAEIAAMQKGQVHPLGPKTEAANGAPNADSIVSESDNPTHAGSE